MDTGMDTDHPRGMDMAMDLRTEVESMAEEEAVDVVEDVADITEFLQPELLRDWLTERLIFDWFNKSVLNGLLCLLWHGLFCLLVSANEVCCSYRSTLEDNPHFYINNKQANNVVKMTNTEFKSTMHLFDWPVGDALYRMLETMIQFKISVVEEWPNILEYRTEMNKIWNITENTHKRTQLGCISYDWNVAEDGNGWFIWFHLFASHHKNVSENNKVKIKLLNRALKLNVDHSR